MTTRMKVEPATFSSANTTAISLGNLANVSTIHHGHTYTSAAAGTILTGIPTATVTSAIQPTTSIQGAQLLGSMDCYEDFFKEITKKLYGDESSGVAIADVLDSSVSTAQPIVYDAADLFRQDNTGALATTANGGLAIVTAPAGTNGLPTGAILVQRRLQDEKGRIWTIEGLPNSGEQIAFATLAAPGAMQATSTVVQSQQQMHLQTGSLQQAQIVLAQQHQPQQHQQVQQQLPQVQEQPQQYYFEERWFESEEDLSWTQSKIARYNPAQKVFRCVDCDFVGFLSRVAEHWLGNHADLRVFQCPRCPYTSAWARCVRMHLTRQHGETLTDNSLWKENPVLEEVTKFLNTLKTKVELKNEPVNNNGEKRYICPFCPYQTDRRDLYNRHENIHRDEKPFQCYVCDKQFNRADHVKKHFIRIHREETYDINKIRKKGGQPGIVSGNKATNSNKRQQSRQAQQLPQSSQTQDNALQQSQFAQQGSSQGVAGQQVPHLAYFNPPTAPGQNGPLQGIPGVGGIKKEVKVKSKGHKKKKSSEKMYTCSYCPWQGVDNWCLKRHLNTHIKPFLCTLCDYKAARSERLATHVIKVHNKRVCHKCSFLADDMESLNQHVQDSHQNPLVKTGFNCNICQDYFELRADLEAHAILEHQKVIVQCDLCDFRTTDELSMEAHLRDKHNLTPGMGAVAAAAAAAMLQASPQVQIPEPMDIVTPEQIPNQPVLTAVTTNQIPVIPTSTTTDVAYTVTESSNVSIPKVMDTTSELQESDPTTADQETLCEKCGIDFIDERSRILHEKTHDLVNQTEEEAVKSGKSSSKRFIRNYICSSCSYTCATKKIMMQHQRAHTGFELVCKAENCMFSTPFENTLKEHIHKEHGSDPCVRCPHCGLQMMSSSAFTSHWRYHHRTMCSLCVNIYRVRYDVKENDIHDLVCKSPSPNASFKDVESSVIKDKDEGTSESSDVNRLDHSSSTAQTEQPLSQTVKSELFPTGNSSLDILYKRESIGFLPRLVEVIVSPMPPTYKKKYISRRRRRKKANWTDKRKYGASESVCDPSNSAYATVSDKSNNNTITTSSAKYIDKILNVIARKESVRRNGVAKISLRRRFCQRGTYSWLFRNPRDGFKCLNSLCMNKCSWRYPRKAGLLLHQLWYHRIPRFKCDICGLQFLHLYKAVLHKFNQHSPEFSRNDSNNL